jgi:hypothetical protein
MWYVRRRKKKNKNTFIIIDRRSSGCFLRVTIITPKRHSSFGPTRISKGEGT